MTTTIARAALLGALLTAGAAHAQDYSTYRPKSSMVGFNYEIAIPVGSLSDDFVSDTSWKGFSFEYRSFFSPVFSAGFGFTYNRYDQTYSNLEVQLDRGGILSGPVYRYADQIALKGLAHYYLMQGAVRPYLGVGLGGVWSYAYAQTADLARSDDGFDFIAAPELGLTLQAAGSGAGGVGLNAAVRYNFTTASFLEVDNAQSVVFVIGLFGSY
jgi:hypothetical protein